ncbi:hypothetical protein J6590_089861 [Homalodisca vitripennis]|nr:hypothetical protein J6590_089861 [Homalodisca vitripennis]
MLVQTDAEGIGAGYTPQRGAVLNLGGPQSTQYTVLRQRVFLGIVRRTPPAGIRLRAAPTHSRGVYDAVRNGIASSSCCCAQVDEPLPSESNEGATSGAVSGNSSTSKRKVKRAFSKVGESSFELGVQPKTKKVTNKQEIVTLLKKSADD